VAARLIRVKVHPGARRNQVEWDSPDSCRVKLTAPPVDGKANEALVEVLAENLGLRRSRITVLRGLTSRQKTVQIMEESSPP